MTYKQGGYIPWEFVVRFINLSPIQTMNNPTAIQGQQKPGSHWSLVKPFTSPMYKQAMCSGRWISIKVEPGDVMQVLIQRPDMLGLQASWASTARTSASHTPCSRSQYRWHAPAKDVNWMFTWCSVLHSWRQVKLRRNQTEIIPQRPQMRWLAKVYFSILFIRLLTFSASGSSPIMDIRLLFLWNREGRWDVNDKLHAYLKSSGSSAQIASAHQYLLQISKNEQRKYRVTKMDKRENNNVQINNFDS